MAQLTGERYPLDSKPWDDIQLFPVAELYLPGDTVHMVDPAYILKLDVASPPSKYWFYAHCRVAPTHPPTHLVVFYEVRNHFVHQGVRYDRIEFAVGAAHVDAFAKNIKLLGNAAYNFFGLTGGAPSAYQTSSAQVGWRMTRGDLAGAVRALGRSWRDALQDPDWWLTATLATGTALTTASSSAATTGRSATGTTSRTPARQMARPKRKPSMKPPAHPEHLTRSEFGSKAMKWGNGNDATTPIKRIKTITKEELVQEGVTREMLVEWRDFYASTAKANPANVSAPGRVKLLEHCVKLFDGG